jgi:tubulin alpha
LCSEHGIKPDGTPLNGSNAQHTSISDSFFMETESGRHLPRAMLIDLDPTVCDEVKKGPIKELFHESNIISGIEIYAWLVACY